MSVGLNRRAETLLFPALSAGEWEKLQIFMEYKNFPAGQLICEAGELGHTMFFIEQGEVELYTIKGKDTKQIVRTLKAGKFFGDGAVLREDKTRTLHVRAKNDVWVWELHRDKFEDVIQAHPEIAIFMLREMAQWFTTLVPANIAIRLEAERTGAEKLVVKTVRALGSIPFLILNTALAVAWMGINRRFPDVIDKPGLPVLSIILGFEAILVTVLVLAKQNADEEDANRRTQAILVNTLGTEREVKSLRASVNELKETIATLKVKS